MCFPLLYSVLWPWVSLLLAPCPKLPLLPFAKGKTIPKSLVMIACFWDEFRSSLLFVASTTSHRFSMGQGCWWGTIETFRLCRPVTPFAPGTHSTKLLCKKRTRVFLASGSIRETLVLQSTWSSAFSAIDFQGNVRQVLWPLALYSLEFLLTM